MCFAGGAMKEGGEVRRERTVMIIMNNDARDRLAKKEVKQWCCLFAGRSPPLAI